MSDLTADAWNAAHPIGTPVIAYPGFRPEHPAAKTLGARRLETRTRSRAWTLGHGTPVVAVDGYAGGISLDHIDLIEECACRQRGQDGDGRVRYQARDGEFVNLPCRDHAEGGPVASPAQPLDLDAIQTRADAATHPGWRESTDVGRLLAEVQRLTAERDQALAALAEQKMTPRERANRRVGALLDAGDHEGACAAAEAFEAGEANDAAHPRS